MEGVTEISEIPEIPELKGVNSEEITLDEEEKDYINFLKKYVKDGLGSDFDLTSYNNIKDALCSLYVMYDLSGNKLTSDEEQDFFKIFGELNILLIRESE